MKLYRVFTFLFTSITTGLAAAFIVLLVRPELLQFGESLDNAAPRLPSIAGPVSYADAVAVAAPAVVNVYATKITRRATPRIFNDPIFKRLFGDELSRPSYKRENSLGSGVIIDDNGYILTNNHVIRGSSEIHIVLRDGRQFDARVVGTDPESDLAVLQASGGDLPVAKLGRSDSLRVGDVVMAIGNPFGVGQTVTQGIISATGRNQLGITNFENFIQTDAAINPGNSGGALINAHGDVIGINTAIFSESGGSHGIGFAIPVNLARSVLAQIAKHGRVIRGWIGINGQNITPALAESFDIESDYGILVSGVLEDGMADKGGIQPGDLLKTIDGAPIKSSSQMLSVIAKKKPGSEITFKLERDGKPLSLIIEVGERPTRER